ncbi:MAG: hypothetical protein V7K38_10900 [Nostoc sp.]|uniref:hypothetical protein n=1 Tax=Nostoc sp. TaxID=1180 RepID=UPI002FF948C7
MQRLASVQKELNHLLWDYHLKPLQQKSRRAKTHKTINRLLQVQSLYQLTLQLYQLTLQLYQLTLQLHQLTLQLYQLTLQLRPIGQELPPQKQRLVGWEQTELLSLLRLPDFSNIL